MCLRFLDDRMDDHQSKEKRRHLPKSRVPLEDTFDIISLTVKCSFV